MTKDEWIPCEVGEHPRQTLELTTGLLFELAPLGNRLPSQFPVNLYRLPGLQNTFFWLKSRLAGSPG